MKKIGRPRIDNDEFRRRLRLALGSGYDVSKAVYRGFTENASVRCVKHGLFSKQARLFLLGHGCPKCSRARMPTTAEWIARAVKKHGHMYDYSKVIYRGNKHKVTIVCPVHGPWDAEANSHLKGCGCPKCLVGLRISHDSFIARSEAAHGAVYDYSKSVYSGQNDPIVVICREHGEFMVTPKAHWSGKGCPSCYVGQHVVTTWSAWVEKAHSIHGDKFRYRDEGAYLGDKQTIRVLCTKHNKAFTHKTGHHLYSGSACPDCKSERHGTSYLETALNGIVHSIAPKARVVENTRSVIAPYEIDLFLPEANLGIEANGLYWHSEERRGADLHQKKAILARDAGVNLYQFWGTELIAKQSVCKSMIQHAMGHSTKLAARKCSIVEVKNSVAASFLNTCHLQGYTRSSVFYGLEYAGTLVSLMSFGVPRFNRNFQWEMIRYASALGIHVMGGASRLWTHFLREHSPKSVVSYADLRYSQGAMYYGLGLEHLYDTKPGYFWWGGYNLGILPRYKTQKHKLATLLTNFNPHLTEVENMRANGYARVFDAGNMVFSYRA